jgi:hypothetical protein
MLKEKFIEGFKIKYEKRRIKSGNIEMRIKAENRELKPKTEIQSRK